MHSRPPQGLYRKAWALEQTVDLHDCPASVARAVLRVVLNDLHSGARRVTDIMVVTGRGKHSSGGKPVLPQDVRAFLRDNNGPETSSASDRAGHFYLKKYAIKKWLKRQ